VFGVPAHLGEAPSWVNENLRDPGYHTALGLLYCGMNNRSDKLSSRTRGNGLLSGLKKLFSQS
jgi:cell division protein FtsA